MAKHELNGETVSLVSYLIFVYYTIIITKINVISISRSTTLRTLLFDAVSYKKVIECISTE